MLTTTNNKSNDQINPIFIWGNTFTNIKILTLKRFFYLDSLFNSTIRLTTFPYDENAIITPIHTHGQPIYYPKSYRTIGLFASLRINCTQRWKVYHRDKINEIRIHKQKKPIMSQ